MRCRHGSTIEERFGDDVARDLAARGHDVVVGPPGRKGGSAVTREPDGLLQAGANPRGMQGYAVGR